jgi:glycosyltransferase involved in cell wall biosynthesis
MCNRIATRFMRFCFLTTFFPPYHFGGDAIFVANLANLLAAAGHSVEVVHCVNAFELLRGSVQPSPVALHPAVKVHALRSAAGLVSPVITQLTGRPGLKYKALASILRNDFDVVHWHNLSLIGGPGALPLGRGIRLSTLHEYWLICPMHILFKYDGAACTERACLKCTLAYRRPPQLWRLGGYTGRMLAHIDRFIAPSAFVRDRYQSSQLGITPDVLPHFFIPRPRHPSPETRGYYLYVGRLEEAKGLQTVLEHFRGRGRRLVVAGSGLYEEELKRLAAGCPDIKFLGRVPYDDLPRWYAGARATIVPSICYETFGLTILESLQQGTPVIASKFGALPEIVRATQGGDVYEDSAGLEAILTRFDRDPDHGRRLGERGAAGLAAYSPEAHLRGYLEIIESCRRRRGAA